MERIENLEMDAHRKQLILDVNNQVDNIVRAFEGMCLRTID